MSVRFISPVAQDIHALVGISSKTYRETFAQDNDPIEFEKYMASAFTPDSMQALLDDPNYHIWLLYQDAGLAGYLTLRNQACLYPAITGKHPIEIHRFYLDSVYHGAGFARQMMDFGLKQAEALGADTVWLGVWEKNPKAQRFYEKQGFEVVGRHDFWVGNDCQNDLLMQKALF